MTGGVVVVGASVGGVRVVQALRARGYEGPIRLIDKESGGPYDKPPLSKAFLTDTPLPDISLTSVGELADLNVEYTPGIEAAGLDSTHAVLHTSAGSMSYDDLVIACGATPRRLHDFEGISGVTTLRTRADALVVREALARRQRIVVLGGGFIGAEVASSARAAGAQVTVIEVSERLMARVLPPETSRVLTDLHRRHGVELVLGCTAMPYAPRGRIEAVVLADGRTVRADLVVVAVGVQPSTGWLHDDSLSVSDGVECDSTLRAVGAAHVWAVGDVARWWHPRLRCSTRVEHWTTAREQAAVVARNLASDEHRMCDLVPFVWSDQHGARIQHVGHAGDAVEVEEWRDGEASLFTYRKNGVVVGATGINAAAKVSRIRRQLAAPALAEELG
ncbi:FAD-dependent oxidoreductase [Dactylosporangium fulvum]|uniref:FAD-dependent oxidoreductase n=1 Tax=Dactylosporangium fulvum TaxID=53359 RepID=A0ABY5VR56_9ACTN|nr:FAD-dependent oxidoreductase [Dactylosporangium fulvum]UWP80228.1 FAD-dependent oxidoreductase [Dactylosporangium fulvum]